MRTGAEYLASIKDDREIYVDGQRVHDVTNHSAFAPIAETMAELFDQAADPASEMTVPAGTHDELQTNAVFRPPRSRDDLSRFRHAVETWAHHTHGWVGRSPDHVGAFVSSFAAHPEAFTTDTQDFSANV